MLKFTVVCLAFAAVVYGRPNTSAFRTRRAAETVLKDAASKIRDVPTETVYDVVVMTNLDDVANVVERELGANPDFSDKLLAILNNRNLTRAEIKTGIANLIKEQPERAKEVLEEVQQVAIERINEIKNRTAVVFKELPKLAQEVAEILDDSSLTIRETILKAREVETKFDVATVRAYKASIASTLLTVFEETGDFDGGVEMKFSLLD